MFKGNPRLSFALLALALSMLAPQASRAQESSSATTSDSASTSSVSDSASTSSVADAAQDKSADQQTQQPAQSGGAQKADTPLSLTAGQKVRRAFRGAVLNPLPYAVSAFTAGITQLNEDRLPHKDNGDKAADWGSRTPVLT